MNLLDPQSLVGPAFTGLGFVVGVIVYWLEARRRNLATEGMTRILLFGAIGGVLIARLIERLVEGANLVGTFDPTSGGRTILGGVVGGWLAVEVAKRRMGIRTSTGPLWALALPAGEFFGRIGCYFNGCCFGKECDLPWAIYQHGALRHPTQIYMAVAALAIFAVVWKLRDRAPIFPIYLVLWSLGRFIIEFFRQPVEPHVGLSLAQKGCLAILALGVYLYAKEASHEQRATNHS
ncbi:MAG: hypothetical protein GC165_08805 [Armatimonadetes bacterium]|nr:hypothetical protein [Armatimonadota bacterium]